MYNKLIFLIQRTGLFFSIALFVLTLIFFLLRRYHTGLSRQKIKNPLPAVITPAVPLFSSEVELFDGFIEEFRISKRERDVIEAMLQGKSNKEIAKTLFITVKTVEVHLSHIYKKTGTANRFALYALIKN
jgi:DNA-binding CsgD family transcriptional regulator